MGANNIMNCEFVIGTKKISFFISVNCKHFIKTETMFTNGVLQINDLCVRCGKIINTEWLYNCPDPNNPEHTHTGDCTGDCL